MTNADLTWLYAVVYGVFFLMGVVIAIYGVAIGRLPSIRRQLMRRLSTQLGLSPDLSTGELAAVVAAYQELGSWRALFAGIGMMSVLAIWGGISWLTTGSLILIGLANGYIMLIVIIGVNMLLLASGHFYGIHRLTDRSPVTIRYADLAPRRLGQVRPPWLFFMQVLFITGLTGLVIIGGVFVPGDLQVELLGGGTRSADISKIWLVLIPAAMVVVLAAAEWAMRRVISMPRLRFAVTTPALGIVDQRIRFETIYLFQAQSANFMLMVALATFQVIIRTSPRGAISIVISSVYLALALEFLALTIAILVLGSRNTRYTYQPIGYPAKGDIRR